MVSLMKIYFLFLITNGHIILGFAFIAHLYREEKDSTSPKGGYILVRAKDNIMVIISIIIATI